MKKEKLSLNEVLVCTAVGIGVIQAVYKSLSIKEKKKIFIRYD